MGVIVGIPVADKEEKNKLEALIREVQSLYLLKRGQNMRKVDVVKEALELLKQKLEQE